MTAEPAVVDTDVASYLFKEDTRDAAYLRILAGRTMVLTFMTLGELHLWVRSRNWGATRRRSLERFLTDFVIAPFDPSMCEAWADAMDSARRRGRPIATAEAWVAATALVLDIPLVTNNPGDYAGVDGLQILTA